MAAVSWISNYCDTIGEYKDKCKQFKTQNVTTLSIKLDDETLFLTPKQYSYLIKFRVITKPDSVIQNSCNEPNCINPHHLVFNESHTLREYDGKKESVCTFIEKLKQIKEMRQNIKSKLPDQPIGPGKGKYIRNKIEKPPGPGKGNYTNRRTSFTPEQMKIVTDMSYTPKQIAEMFDSTVSKVNNARNYYKLKNK